MQYCRHGCDAFDCQARDAYIFTVVPDLHILCCMLSFYQHQHGDYDIYMLIAAAHAYESIATGALLESFWNTVHHPST
jgi:hypothetical protein